LKLPEYRILWTVLAHKGRVIKFRRLSVEVVEEIRIASNILIEKVRGEI
jgi:hypothetical protein